MIYQFENQDLRDLGSPYRAILIVVHWIVLNEGLEMIHNFCFMFNLKLISKDPGPPRIGMKDPQTPL